MLAHAALAVGIAEGAIMDLVELAGTGVKQLFMTTPLVETERFKEGLARLDAELMAARALLDAQIACVWQNAERVAAKATLTRAGRSQGASPTWPAWRSNCKRRSGSPRPASALPKAALNSLEAGPCTKARRCNEGCGIFASRRNTWRSVRATTLRRGPPCSRASRESCIVSRWTVSRYLATEAIR